uniref:Gdnf family receptor alpha 1a n=1 Tax=Nothobranchius furzeri TaxID=105023 RepID=A0A8C6MEB2_NOTFU
MILAALYVLLPLLDALCSAEEKLRTGATRLDCVRASEQCLREQACSTKYRTMRQCVAGGKESNFSIVAGLEAKDECRSAMEALKQSPLYNCRCKRGMKKEKNCLRIYWGIYQTLQGNDFLEDSPYEAVNSRLSDIFRLAPIIDLSEEFTTLMASATLCGCLVGERDFHPGVWGLNPDWTIFFYIRHRSLCRIHNIDGFSNAVQLCGFSIICFAKALPFISPPHPQVPEFLFL